MAKSKAKKVTLPEKCEKCQLKQHRPACDGVYCYNEEKAKSFQNSQPSITSIGLFESRVEAFVNGREEQLEYGERVELNGIKLIKPSPLTVNAITLVRLQI